MRFNPFRKSPPLVPVVPVSRPPALQARADRMARIIDAVATHALDGKHGKKVAKLAASEKLRRQLELIDALGDEEFAEFLDMLEAGVPAEFRHMLRDRV